MSIWLVSGFCVVAFGLCLWYYFYFLMPFSKLPSTRFDIHIIKLCFRKEKITTSGFQKFIYLSNQYLNEGLFVLWTLKPLVTIVKEEYMKIMVNQSIQKPRDYQMIFGEAFGNGLFTCDEALWRKRRKMFDPAFRTKMVMNKIPIFNKYSKRLVHELNELQRKEFVDVEKLLKEFSFHVIHEAIMGSSLDNILTSEKQLTIELSDRCAAFLSERFAKPWLYFLTVFPEVRAFKKNMKKLDEITRKILMNVKDTKSRRIKVERTDDGNVESEEFSKSFAEVLLEHHAKDPDFTEKDMMNEIKLFISAGYDTVASALNWCLCLLGNYPKVQDRLYEEIADLEENLSFEDLQNLEYMECVIMETLRLYPPVPFFARTVKNEMQCGKYRIPKGTTTIAFTFVHHRNPNVFRNPNEFDPDRFLDENLMKNQWTSFAFSTGIRNCIGQKFAMLEMKTALVHILRKFKIVSHSEIQDDKISWEVVIKSDHPLLMRFIPRQSILQE